MVERNLYLVLINVERYAHTTAGRADLIQEGAAALYRAVDGFEWERGLLFRTYAVHWLNQAFRAYIYNFTNTVRVPVYLQKAMRHVQQAIVKLGDPDASPAEIAEVSGLGENLVVSALDAMRSTRSIDAPLAGDEDASGLRELLQTPEEGPYSTDLEEVSLVSGLGEALDRLSDREQRSRAAFRPEGRARAHAIGGRRSHGRQPRAGAADPDARDHQVAHADPPQGDGSVPQQLTRGAVRVGRE
jgi:RNA polymerase sigma factor (sigma-70 family)